MSLLSELQSELETGFQPAISRETLARIVKALEAVIFSPEWKSDADDALNQWKEATK